MIKKAIALPKRIFESNFNNSSEITTLSLIFAMFYKIEFK